MKPDNYPLPSDARRSERVRAGRVLRRVEPLRSIAWCALLLHLAVLGCASRLPAATNAGPAAAIGEAPPAAPPSAPPLRSAAALEKLAMPIALHPDPLIAIILPASVYPVEIVQAARFVKDPNNLPRVDQQPWDDKVKQVAKFPEVIAMMDQDLAWTVELGQAFLAQPMDLMNAIQELRAKAQKAGSLKSTAQQVVTVTNAVVERTYQNQVVYVTNTVIQVAPSSKETVYVPTYNPSVVYVDDDDDEAAVGLVSFGVGMAFGAAIWGDCDWHYGGCYWGGYPPPPPPYPPPYYPPPGAPPPPPANRPPGTTPPGETRPPGQTRPPGETRPPGDTTRPPSTTRPSAQPATGGTSQRWQPDQNRLSSSGAASAATREARGWGGASTQPATRPATGGAGSRPAQPPSTGTAGTRPATQPTHNWSQQSRASTQPARAPGTSAATPAQRPASPAAGARPTTMWQQPSASGPAQSRASTARPAPSPGVSRPSAQPSSAFSGMSSGGAARSASSRGAASRGGGGRGGGRGR